MKKTFLSLCFIFSSAAFAGTDGGFGHLTMAMRLPNAASLQRAARAVRPPVAPVRLLQTELGTKPVLDLPKAPEPVKPK